MLEGVASRLRKAADDPFGVFNAAQDHVLRAGRVHVDRLVLDAFAPAVERCEDAEVQALLERVCDLYALSAIEEDCAWFLEPRPPHGVAREGRDRRGERPVRRAAPARPCAGGRVRDPGAVPAAPMLTS